MNIRRRGVMFYVIIDFVIFVPLGIWLCYVGLWTPGLVSLVISGLVIIAGIGTLREQKVEREFKGVSRRVKIPKVELPPEP